MRRNEIHCIFIYNGKAPIHKRLVEKAKRRDTRNKLEENIYNLEEALNNYHKTGLIDKILKDLYSKRKSPKRLLKPSDTKIDMQWVEYKIKQKQGQLIHINTDDFAQTKVLFDILNVPYYTAPGEAEKFCAQLCIAGMVDAVLSEDTDVLAYSSPIFLSNINTHNDTCTIVSHEDILLHLELTKDQFLDLCIMCGTDYNPNIPRVGPHTAYKHLIEHNSIENIGTNTKLNISVLNHVRSRQLFTEFQSIEFENVKYCGQPDFDKLTKFINDNNININLDKLSKSFTHNIVMIND